MIVIKDYKDRALIMGKNKIVLCKLENDFCDNVQGYDKVESFRGAQLFEDDGKYYIFIVQGEAIITYQLTANGKVKDKKECGATSLGQIVGQDKGDSLALACAPSLNNYFVLKIVKSRQFAQAIY